MKEFWYVPLAACLFGGIIGILLALLAASRYYERKKKKTERRVSVPHPDTPRQQGQHVPPTDGRVLDNSFRQDPRAVEVHELFQQPHSEDYEVPVPPRTHSQEHTGIYENAHYPDSRTPTVHRKKK